MAKSRTDEGAAVGVAENGNGAVLVTLARDGALLDRRHIELTHDLPTHPYHHEGSWAVGRYLDSPWAKRTSLAEAVALVARVHAAADEGAHMHLEALAGAIAMPIATIALRVCAPLPDTTEARIADARAATMADSILYRRALATAAEARGWAVHWYDRDDVVRAAAAALASIATTPVEAFLAAIGKRIGPPWQAKHKLAATAALAALATPE